MYIHTTLANKDWIISYMNFKIEGCDARFHHTQLADLTIEHP